MTAIPQESVQPAVASPDDPLLECLSIVTRLHGRPVSARALAAGLPLQDHRVSPALFVRAAEGQGYSARLARRRLDRISPLLLPAVLLLADGGACVLTAIDRAGGQAEAVFPESGFGARRLPVSELAAAYTGHCLFVQPRARPDRRIDPTASLRAGNWFWGVVWRFRRFYVEAAAAALVVNVLTVATSLFVMNVYDRVVPNNAMETLLVLATGTLVALAFEFIARNLRAYFLDIAGKKADILLAGTLFNQAMALRMEVMPASPGAFAAQMREFESLRDFIASATLVTVTDLPFIVFFLWVVHMISGPLWLVPLAAVPIVLGAALIAQIPLARLMRQHMQESTLKHGLLVESVEGIDTLKTLSAEGIMQRRWEDYTALTGETAVRSRFISGFVVNLSVLAQQVATIGMVAWGVVLIGTGDLTVGALIAAVMISGRALSPLGQVAALVTRYQQARVSHRMLDEIMRRPRERDPDRQYLHRPELQGDIAFENVDFAYPRAGLAALERVSFRIAAGEHVAILGRIGSGKTTILKLILGLYRPTGGTVLLDGADSAQFDPADVRRNIAYVAQEPRLFQGSVRDNITLGAPLADDAEVLAAARLSGLDRMVEQHPLGFDLPVAEGGVGLSGGQRQAVAIARALVTRAPILLLDEPTSAMDHTAEQHFIAGLKDYARGRTLVLVTHKPTMLNLVDRIVVIERGRLLLDGPRDQILKQLLKQV